MSSSKPKTILFLTRSLVRGGAERQLVSLAKGLAKQNLIVKVAVFYRGGALEKELTNAGIPIIDLKKSGRWDIVPFLFRLTCITRLDPPLVLHSYLSVANILAALLKPLMKNTRVAWSVRASDMDLAFYDRLTRLSYYIECLLSRFADITIANSIAGLNHAIAHGFPPQKMVVIPNGIDTQYFRPDVTHRKKTRSAWNILDDEILVGLVARLDPMKGHYTFLKAAKLLETEPFKIRFVCVGDGPQDFTNATKQHAIALNISSRLIWAGAYDDMPGVYNALDIFVSSSNFGEGFSNTIAEAMACGTPCIVTNTGDASLIVGTCGAVITPGDHIALAHQIKLVATLNRTQRARIGRDSRQRIESEFSVTRLVERTQQALDLN